MANHSRPHDFLAFEMGGIEIGSAGPGDFRGQNTRNWARADSRIGMSRIRFYPVSFLTELDLGLSLTNAPSAK